MGASSVDVAVVGAGPYGLSVAANVITAGRSLRVFGNPLQTWCTAMPAGMKLKSDGFASNLSAPGPGSTLGEFCRTRGIPYGDKGEPVSLETFVAYGLDFQRRFVPHLETVNVSHIGRSGDGFRLTTEEGQTVLARRVVLAVGVTHFRVAPRELADLPASLASHSADHRNMDRFAGRDIAIVGAGASAVDLAAALIDAGARPKIVTRADRIRFASEPTAGEPPLLGRLTHPSSPLGPGWRSRLASDLPQIYRLLPARLRLNILRRHLGPSSAWYLRGKVLGGAEVLAGHHLQGAAPTGNGVRLKLGDASGKSKTLDVDHVIAATGYWPQIERLQFLDKSLRGAIRHVAGVPILSHDFETSAPGLYATGLAAASSFGPLMRFVAGADYTARRIVQHLETTRVRRNVGVADSRAPRQPEYE
ncbi:NAD(P)/FAD-dependent oxidoreductase [Mesorhizobium sp. B2-9-1]|uniref:NAD(P)-binding domain-containing protein n=1 Tax=unclassified Mesorhizobium TaxID=325217 RepID=UPI001127AA78|nr:MULTISPECIES: NAD(P)-binding domain-containing protein [unclassified Mesorhizobium]TPI47061.1 NAD(P)/FAD-dependent oxidoreductase [Mesorhizobium sp. B2-9-1]TPJ25379.1 NAD(P)/FAD-dependent oxidoreductase [Mesorhizobium sp. B2-7-2]